MIGVDDYERRHGMATGSVFVNNRTQAVRLPAESRFPGEVKKVTVRVLGHDRVLSPVDKTWNSFFLSEERVSPIRYASTNLIPKCKSMVLATVKYYWAMM